MLVQSLVLLLSQPLSLLVGPLAMGGFTPEELQQLAKGTYPLLLNSVSAGSLLIWDYIVTLSAEVELVWKSRLSAAKIIFFIMRYLSIVIQCVSIAVPLMNFAETESSCKSYIWFRSLSSTISICTSQILLIYRTLAFYNWNYPLQIFLGALFLATNISIVALLILGISRYIVIPNPYPSFNRVLGGCITTGYPKMLGFVWVPEVIFQSILFLLVFLKFGHGYLEFWRAGRSRQASQIYLVFIRDGVWVYIIQLVILLLCVLYNQHASFLGLDFIIWQITVTSICCTRLLLNLRSTGPQGTDINQTTPSFIQNIESIEFKSLRTSERQLRSGEVHIEVETVTHVTETPRASFEGI